MPERYRTIVADPPWPYQKARIPTRGVRQRAGVADHYETMTLDEIASLAVGDLAADNAHLYLWTTCPFLFEARPIVESWGFRYVTLLTWHKTGALGMGFHFRTQTEHVLFCVRGKLPILPENRVRNIFAAGKGAHSAKPEAFYDIVESVSPGPYLEMFSRRARLGWDTWGDEALHGTELIA